MDKTKLPPYENKEIEGIYDHVKKGTFLMKSISKTDPKFWDYFDRYLRLVDYFTASLDPIEGMRILVDKRHESGNEKL